MKDFLQFYFWHFVIFTGILRPSGEDSFKKAGIFPQKFQQFSSSFWFSRQKISKYFHFLYRHKAIDNFFYGELSTFSTAFSTLKKPFNFNLFRQIYIFSSQPVTEISIIQKFDFTLHKIEFIFQFSLLFLFFLWTLLFLR